MANNNVGCATASWVSMISFVVLTLVYFAFLKPAQTIADLLSVDAQQQFHSKNMRSLALYVLLVVFSQLMCNMWYLSCKCGGLMFGKNIAAVASLYTLIPWFLIFAVVIGVLLVFPGFKSAFSDVIGYFAVASSANELFSSILIGADLSEKINATSNPLERQQLTKAAEAILKIVGNRSILINKMTVDNFLEIWDTLRPLMVPEIANNDADVKQKVFDLVVLKDNIGEGLWYLYTSVLISSIVYYNLATRGCVKSVEQIKADHEAYKAQQKAVDEKAEVNNSTTYQT